MDALNQLLENTLHFCIKQQWLVLEEIPQIELSRPSQKSYGDFSTNLALVLAASQKKNPREIAKLLIDHLQDPQKYLSKIEIAGPGFINLTLSQNFYAHILKKMLLGGANWGSVASPAPERILIEYVSANPTGPLHIGHGRNAVVGDTLARLLRAVGHTVVREFYVNDHGVQIRTLGASVLHYYKKQSGDPASQGHPPEGTYQGAYLEEWVLNNKDRILALGEDVLLLGKEAGKDLLKKIEIELKRLGIEFDRFFSESSLYETGAIERVIRELKRAGHLFVEEGATWFRSSDFSDDKDRVLIKQDQSYTYFTPDIAYHLDKFERRFDRYINVWGADHGGYVPRIRAAIQALGYDAQKLEVVLIQMVQLKKAGERVQMSKRAGTYVTLEEVVDEVGSDAVRFFFLLRSSNAQLDFDLDLAKKQSAENPVFYVQYAHARIASVFRKASEQGFDLSNLTSTHLAFLDLPEERELVLLVAEYPDRLLRAARELAPHAVVFYLLELAKAFQAYYSRAKSDARYRVLNRNASNPKDLAFESEQSLAKLALLDRVGHVLRHGLELVGVRAPEKMQLEFAETEQTEELIGE